MKLSVVIISWNAIKYVKSCLDTIIDATRNIDSEIIFIDNGSTDGTGQLIQKDYPYIYYYNTQNNLGVSKARNIGIKQAKGEYVLFLDIDTESNATAIETLVSFMDAHPDVGISGCKLTSPEGDAQLSCLKLPSLPHKLKNVLLILIIKIQRKWKPRFLEYLGGRIWDSNTKYFYMKEMEGIEPFESEYLLGACQCIRREVFAMVGLLDEHIFYGPEDADFCVRCHKANKKVMYLPSVSIIHHYQKITNKKIFSKISLKHFQGLLYFFWKHKRLW